MGSSFFVGSPSCLCYWYTQCSTGTSQSLHLNNPTKSEQVFNVQMSEPLEDIQNPSHSRWLQIQYTICITLQEKMCFPFSSPEEKLHWKIKVFFFSPPHSLLWEWRIYFSICSTRLKEQSILRPFDASLNQTDCFLMLSPFF